MIEQIRLIMNNSDIPDDVTFSQLLSCTPNMLRDELLADPAKVHEMTADMLSFESRWGDANKDYIYLMVYKHQGEFNLDVASEYDVFMGIYCTYCPVVSANMKIRAHITFLIVWYGILEKPMRFPAIVNA
jgi:hypothetical protein